MKKIAILIGLAVCTNAFSAPSQDKLWNDIEQVSSSTYKQTRSKSIEPHALKRRSLSLNEDGLRQYLFVKNTTSKSSKNTKVRILSTSKKVLASSTVLDLPLPNGEYIRVNVIESPILSADQAANHPNIKTWRVVGVDDPSISGRIDFTSQGFHGMLVLGDGDTIFIDPDKATNIYYSLSKRENAAHFESDFQCEVHGKHSLLSNQALSDKSEQKNLQSPIRSSRKLSGNKLAKLPDTELVTYRLAVAGTAEYTANLGGQTSAYASMVTTINRVNDIYQRDLGVKLELVSGESILYTNATTDPYTNNSASALVDENMANLDKDTVLGRANFDIGHVFADGVNGGLAYVGVACLGEANVKQADNSILTVNGIKAGGASGLYNPQGDIFSIHLVAHELGHQLGADHTFNGVNGFCNGNVNLETAVEPGSGSTIMSYSGNCGTDDLQAAPDAIFHWKSISQINEYTRVDTTGISCGTRTSTGHQVPVVNAGSDYIIPVNTPFLLDGEAIAGTATATYAWDQINAGTPSKVDVDKGDNAIIRSEYPTDNPDRYIPRLSDLFTGGHTVGEILPQTVRNLNFSFIVRDSNGEIANDEKLISTEDTGTTFKVLSHNLDETLSTGQTTTVSWEVASTTEAPISCSTVNIQLLRENGVKNNLLMGTANDGDQTVVISADIPSMINARIMVACATQPFFQISAGKIQVNKIIDNIVPVITLTGSSTVSLFKGQTYVEEGATATDNLDSVVDVIPTGSVDTSTIGAYTVTYNATDSSGNAATPVTRTVTVTGDTIAPVITLTGSSTVSLFKGQIYVEEGATATDNIDSVVDVIPTGGVETSTIGTYIITYNATDSLGNAATPVTRTVMVAGDTIAPVITLTGSSTASLLKGQTYVEEGATATDNIDLVVGVITTGSIDTSTIGVYTVTYNATDSSGNVATAVTRTVDIVKPPEVVVVNITNNVSSGGGSMGLLLLPLMLFGLRRRLLAIIINR